MTWVEIRDSDPESPWVLTLRRLLGDDDTDRALAIMVRALLWTARNQHDGDLSRYDLGDLAWAWRLRAEDMPHVVEAGIVLGGPGTYAMGADYLDRTARMRRERARSAARRAAEDRGETAERPRSDRGATAAQYSTEQYRTGHETESSISAERSALTLEPAPGRAPRARRPRPAPEGPHEADPADTETEVVAEVPSTQGPVRVRRALVEALRATAPGVDVDLEVRRAAEWSAANPTRRKTPGGTRRFLGAWMARQQDRGGGGGSGMGPAPRGPYRGSQRPQTQGERIAELEAREASGTMGPGEAGELTRWRLRNLGGLELVAGGVR